MARPKCWDGRQHRWQSRHRVTMERTYPRRTPHPSEQWCERCGKWMDDLLTEPSKEPSR